jgi:antitoxin (DNA-binding transcriptional repressor) of toxin-antitoxin stability system
VITINIHKAKTQLSRLVDEAAGGKPFIIAKAGRPMVKVTALDTPTGKQVRRLGFLRGLFSVPDDFNTMGSSEIERMFQGEEWSCCWILICCYGQLMIRNGWQRRRVRLSRIPKVSASSVLRAYGKLPLNTAWDARISVDARRLRRGLLDNGYAELPITSEHAINTDQLAHTHKDPVDRILLAQAMVEGMTLVTNDRKLATYPGPVRKV